MKGIIKKLEEKGFGFISMEGQKDIFFHANDCSNGDFKQMQEGQTVSFETTESEKGPRAVNVVVVMDGEAANNNDNMDEEAPTEEAPAEEAPEEEAAA